MTKRLKNNQIGLTLVLAILCALVLIPFLIVVSISFSDETRIVYEGYGLFPRGFTLSAYKFALKDPTSVLNAYKVTFSFSVISMVLSVLLMAMLAFGLSKKNLRGKNIMSFYVYFTMLFGGGLVPTYILMTQYLHLGNTFLVYIIRGLISPWYVFMMRTFFQGVPYEITESAVVDGASEYTIFFRMILPLSKPVLATVALFMFLGKWNDWYTCMLYINDESLISLQYLLQRIMLNIQLLQEDIMNSSNIPLEDIPSETVRMAMAIIVAGPALLVFPFFQKYFVKGLTVGSVKG